MRPGIALIGLAIWLLAGIWLACLELPAQAATTERIVVNRFSGVAIEGFDPVGYFVDGTAQQGTEEFEANLWGGLAFPQRGQPGLLPGSSRDLWSAIRRL